MNAAVLNNVVVTRSGNRILDQVTVEIPAGSLTLVSGSNGSGKSTLLRVICGLCGIDGGELSVLGTAAPLPSRVRQRVRVTLDEPALWPWMTARKTVSTISHLAGEPTPDISRVLMDVGLDETDRSLRYRRTGKFSQGMRKRLQVASVLALPGDIFLLDEPTTSLDAEGTGLIWEAIRRRHEAGATFVIATHQPVEEIANLLDVSQVVQMSHGRATTAASLA